MIPYQSKKGKENFRRAGAYKLFVLCALGKINHEEKSTAKSKNSKKEAKKGL
jgi:hypothetical protein